MRTYAFGWDFGNGETKAVVVVKGVQYRITIPTAFSRVNIAAMESLTRDEDEASNEEGKSKRGGKAKKPKAAAFVPPVVVDADPNKPAVLEPDKVIIRMENESMTYAFGNYALGQVQGTWNGNDDNQRYASKYALKGLLASAALLVPDTEFGLLVVSGIPATLYIKYPELRRSIKAALDGTYRFTLDDGNTWRTITVEVATVVMEGAGALLAYPGITNATEAGVIDIGSGTTDLYGQIGASPIIEYCQGKDIAVSKATNIVRKTFELKEKRELTDREARDIMHAFVSARKTAFPEIKAFGRTVAVEELQAMVEEAVETIGEDIATFIVQTWKQGIGRLSPIVLIGGGILYFYPAIKNRIEHAVLHDDPVFANPRGYATLAAKRLIARQKAAAETAAQTSQEAIGS